VDNPVNPVESPIVAAPVASPSVPTDTAYANPNAVLVIPRVVFNYVVIAIAFFALGFVISALASSAIFNANSKENKQLINDALDQVVSKIGANNTAAAEPQGPDPNKRYTISDDGNPFIGSSSAPITIVEFSDFHCPYCGRFARETFQPLLKDFDGKIKIVFRDYPILGQSSLEAALAAGCANEQNAFWPFHDLLFNNQQSLTRDAYLSYAKQLNLKVDQFTTCYDKQKYMDEIKKDYTYAQGLGITGTPTFFINGKFVSGAQPYSVFADAIKAELSTSQESTPEPAPSS
jgi:protein-disulfide isomerase